MMTHEYQAQSQSRPLGHQSASGHSLHLPSHPIHQEEAQQDVHQILEECHKHGRTCILCSYEPAVEAILSQYGRCSPYAYAEVDVQLGQSVSIGMHDACGYLEERPLQYHHRRTDDAARLQSLAQDGLHAFLVFLTMCLSHQPGGAHAQEAHQPVHHIEDGGTQSHCADKHRASHVAHDGAIHHSQQRYADVADDGRQGELEYSLMDIVFGHSLFDIEFHNLALCIEQCRCAVVAGAVLCGVFACHCLIDGELHSITQ